MAVDARAILLLEDEENDALLLKRAFQKIDLNYPVYVVSNGEEGLAYLTGLGKFQDRATFPLPGIIITDLKMPRKNGIEFLQWLSEHPQFRVVPTLVLTSSKAEADVLKAYGHGANSYLVKPTDFTKLEKLAQLILEYWEACEKPVMRL